jgi:LPXTG-motif cell wall-anchored protein
MKKLLITAFLLLAGVTVYAQGPPPGGATGVPIDGGVLAFLGAAGALGAGLLVKKKKK